MNRTKVRRQRVRKAWGSTHVGKCKRTGKARFSDAPAAWSAALRVSRVIGAVRAYLCPLCDGWHLTTQPLRTPKERP